VKDPGKALRTAIYNVLNGNLMLDVSTIPVYDTFGSEVNQDNFVAISNINETDSSNKSNFATDMQVTLDVVTRAQSYDGNEDAENIANQILTLLLPTPQSTLTATADFQFLNLQRSGSNYLSEQTDTGYVFRKLLTLSVTVVQKQ